MNDHKQTISCIAILFILMGFHSAAAGTRRLNPDKDENLLCGLKSLKAQVEQVKLNNRWLARENDSFRQQIYLLEQELERLEQKSPSPQQDIDEEDRISREQSDISRQDYQRDLRAQEARRQQQHILTRHTEDQEDAQMTLQDDIIQMKQEVVYLENEIHQLKSIIDKKTRNLDYVSEKNRLLELRTDSEFNLKLIRREIQSLKKRYYKPLSQLSNYREEQIVLKQQLVIAEDVMKIFITEEKKLRHTTHQLEISKKETIENFFMDIKSLGVNRMELEDILNKAKKKIKTNKIDLSASNAEFFQFEENLKILKHENNLLKKDLFNLKKLFKEAYN